jgi:hypothetical protein
LWGRRLANSPSAAIRGRCHGGLREGGWLAYGLWPMRLSHDAPGASVTGRVGGNVLTFNVLTFQRF